MMDRLPRPRPAVEKMAPYHPPSAGRGGKVRLDFNENTEGCSPKVAAFLSEAIAAPDLTVYPEYTETRPILAEFFGVEDEQMVLTNGTDEAIQVLVNTFVDDDEEVIILTPSYAMYRFYSELAGANVITIPYQPDTLAFPINELLRAITPRTKAILISNPNNPTGTAAKLPMIEQVLERAEDIPVLIDEAYYEFCGITALGLLDEHPNLFVSRTFSKVYGLAALRVGMLFSNEMNVEMMRKAQSPYSVNRIASMAAAKAVRDQSYITSYVTEILAARELTYVGLERLNIPYFNSDANFVLMKFGDRAAAITAGLKKRGILVRDRSYEIAGCVRVTVGSREQMRLFLAELEALWRK